jgi:SAM-dependent methyltransferase
MNSTLAQNEPAGEAPHATDAEWEKWGARDPYFGVLTHERFRSTVLTASDYDDFFDSGRQHVQAVLATCRRHFGEAFSPASVLDFGCGVGRILIPFSEVSDTVVGTDVSESMLAEARRNCARFGIRNAALVKSDDALSAVQGPFDLVHSTIVLQHIESERGLDILSRLVSLVAPGGVVAIQVTYGRSYGECRYGRPMPPPPEPAPPPMNLYRRMRAIASAVLKPAPRPVPVVAADPAADDAPRDPQMLMYHYDLSRIAYIFHAAGATEFHAEFTDHGGELGAMLYAQMGIAPLQSPADTAGPAGVTQGTRNHPDTVRA